MGASLHHCTLLVGVDAKTLYSGWWKNASVMLVSNSVVGTLLKMGSYNSTQSAMPTLT